MVRLERLSPIDVLSAKYGLTMADNVLVKRTPVTEALGLAGLSGHICGHTTPSVTGVEVVGESRDDFAVGVLLTQREATIWFAPTLLQFVDHAPGTEISLEGVPKKWVRRATGEWDEIAVPSPENPIRRVLRRLGLLK